MALKDRWEDRIDGEDYVMADDVNAIAQAVIELENVIEDGSNITIDSELSLESENPVQNKVVTQEFEAFNETVGEINRRVSALESGGVGGGGVTSWNDLTDKPFGEVVETIEPITWDGNTEGLLEVTPEGFDYGTRFYKVSDRIFSIEQLKSMIYSTFSDNIDYEDEEFTYTVGDEWENLILEGCITEDIFDLYGEVCIVRKPGATETSYGCTFPETGVYFFKTITENVRVSYANSLYIEGNSFATVKQLDNKYLEPFELQAGSETDILPKQDIQFVGGEGVPEDVVVLAAGETYCVIWDTNEYVLEAKNVVFDGIDGIAIGNTSLIGVGEDTGEEFVLGYAPAYDINVFLTQSTEDGMHSVRIYQSTPDKWLLKEEYLPFNAIAAYIDNYIDEALGGDY